MSPFLLQIQTTSSRYLYAQVVISHQPQPDPARPPPEIPVTPAPQPEIEPAHRPQPEIPQLPPDPAAPSEPQGPEIIPGQSPPEFPGETEGRSVTAVTWYDSPESF